MNQASVVIELFGGPAVQVGGEAVSLSPLQTCLLAVVFGSGGLCRVGPATGSRMSTRRRGGGSHGGRGGKGSGGTSRSRLARLLWEEDSPEARHRLSQLLYSLSRKPSGGTLLQADPDTVFPGSCGEAADLIRCRKMLDEGAPAGAVALLEKGYLAGVTMIPGRLFEEWLEREQARMVTAVREVAVSDWTRLSRAESWKDASRAADALLRLDPYDEAALRNVLLSRGMAGEVHEALAEYAGFQARLRPETGRWAPEPETRDLIERLESLSIDSDPLPREVRRDPEPEPELRGRDEELATLNRAVSRPSLDSSLTTIVVTGEGGIGKTRLVEEAIRGARLRGFRILRAGSSEFERDIPLNPLLESLDHADCGEAIHGLEEPWYSVLLSLLPQFHDDPGPLPEVPWVEPGNLPRRTYEALRRLLESLTETGPTLLFLDDFQWADETSVAAVEFLRRRWKGGRLVVIIALRQLRTPRRSRAEEFGEELVQSGQSLHIGLEELDEEAVHQLIDSVAGRELGPSELRRISLLGGSNPFFTVELTHEYVQGHLDLAPTPADFIPVPVSIRQLLERRLEELTPLGERILAILAVLGDVCSVGQLTALCDRSRADSAAAVDHLQSARLVRWSDGGFALKHQLVRHTVYSRLQEATRRTLHEQIAEWLLAVGNAGPGELALHFDRAGRSEEALRFALEAAEAAEASGAVPEAVHLLTTARRNTTDPEKAAEIVGRLGHLHHMHRNFTEAAPLLDVAAERFRQQGRISEALSAEVEKIDALSRLELLPLQDFSQKAQELKQEARERGEWETLINLLDVEIHTLDREGKVDAVRAALKEAEELCDKGSPAAQCAARATLAIHFLYGSPATALKVGREACQIAREHELSNVRLLACNRLIATLIPLGLLDTTEGRSLIETAESLSARSGDRRHRFFLPLNRGVWHLDVGELDRAGTYFSRAEQILNEHPDPEFEANLYLNVGELAYINRDIVQANHYFSEVVNRIGNSAGIPANEIGRAGMGLCALYNGRLSDAATILDSLGEEPEDWVYDRYLIALFRARILRRRGRILEAAELLDSTGRKVRQRFTVSWIKMKLEQVRLLQMIDSGEALAVAREAYSVAGRLSLGTRARELQLLIDLIN